MGKTLQAETIARAWPKEGPTRVPFWVYTDPDVFAREMDVFFYGDTWNYVALDCEIPAVGSYKLHQSEQAELIHRALRKPT